MKQITAIVISNVKVSNNVYKLCFFAGKNDIYCGQFVELKLDGLYLRRPFSVFDYDDEMISVLYKTVGVGTEYMTKLKEGDDLDVLIGLGNGYPLDNTHKPLLVGGGIGIAPLFFTANELLKKGITPNFVLGFRNAEEAIQSKLFVGLGNITVTTDDGSEGFCGNAIQAVSELNIEFDKYFACGPLPMLKTLQKFSNSGFLSLEARMGCGFGACMGCTIKTIYGPKRVCKEGPVFSSNEVIF